MLLLIVVITVANILVAPNYLQDNKSYIILIFNIFHYVFHYITFLILSFPYHLSLIHLSHLIVSFPMSQEVVLRQERAVGSGLCLNPCVIWHHTLPWSPAWNLLQAMPRASLILPCPKDLWFLFICLENAMVSLSSELSY
jgi:hypothetical protein